MWFRLVCLRVATNFLCSSNHHDVYADLIRDITRREKIRVALAVDLVAGDAEVQPEDAADDDDQPDSAQQTSAVQEENTNDDDDDEEGSGDDAAAAEASGTLERDPMPTTFRPRLGTTVALREVARLLPANPDNPFTHPVHFADRLGVFLSDGEPFPPGQFPQPDGGVISVFPFADLQSPEPLVTRFRVHARAQFHGQSKYSFVEATSGPDLWYGRVWLLFQCRFRGESYNLALVSWLQSRAGAPFGTRKPTFSWASRFLDCIEVEHLRRVVIVVPSLVSRTKAQGPVLHLLV